MFVGFGALGINICNAVNNHTNNLSRLVRQLSSGQRITCAADDAAGLAISEKMRAQIRGLNQAARNVQDGISLIQVAEGHLNETHSILQRIRELVVQASNGTNSPEDRNSIQNEISMLIEEVDRIAGTSEFNKKKLLDGSLGEGTDGLHLQVGANAGNSMLLVINDMGAEALGIKDIDVTKAAPDDISALLDRMDDAIGKVSGQRSALGAYHNVLEHRINYLENASLNLQEAESRIRDLDMAKAIIEYTKTSLCLQAAQAMLSQLFNLQREQVYSLLGSLPGTHSNS